MQSIRIYPNSFSDIIMRFLVITVLVVVWCGLAIPVEGKGTADSVRIAEMKNCIKAIDEVANDPESLEKATAFTALCEEFIEELQLQDNHKKLLKLIALKQGKNATSSDTDNKSEEEETTKKKEQTSPDKQGKKKGKDEKPSAPKTSKTDKDTSSTQAKEESKKVKADSKKKLEEKIKDNISKEKDAVDEVKAEPKKDAANKVKAQPKIKIEFADDEPEVPLDDKPQMKQAQDKDPRNPSMPFDFSDIDLAGIMRQAQNLDPTKASKPLDFSNIDIAGIMEEEWQKIVQEMRENRFHPTVQLPEDLLDPIAEGVRGAQYGFKAQYKHQSGEEPQYRQQEWSTQFQDPALAVGIPPNPTFQQQGIPDPSFQQGFPDPSFQQQGFPDPSFHHQGIPDPSFHQQGYPNPNKAFQQQGIPEPSFQQQGIPDPSFQQQGYPDPTFQQGMPNPTFQQGIPNPAFQQQQGFPNPAFQQQEIPNPTFQQQGIPQFPQQPQFGEPFQHQHFDHMHQVPPTAEWEAGVPNQEIPQPNIDTMAADTVHQTADQQQQITKEETQTKRPLDEL